MVLSILELRCGLAPDRSDPDVWRLREGARIHSEDELCTMIGPDAICALETMRSGLLTLDESGVSRHEELAKVPLEHLPLIAAQLPRSTQARHAALVAVRAALSAPWNLSDNFIACTKKDTQKMFLSISGTLHASFHDTLLCIGIPVQSKPISTAYLIRRRPFHTV
ncbi:MAG: DUF3591 domain-containing protein [Gammaproteobacteria bacterium]|nr:DUF3591 domain-containing protein [Gammaproteobacteria bacterium]